MDIFVQILGIAAAAPKAPKFLDTFGARLTILAIRLYRVSVSSWRKRDCLFNPSCSRWSENLIAEYGFSEGTKRAYIQVQNCCGDYRIQLDSSRKITLVAKNGDKYLEEKLSPYVIEKFKQFPST
jgi:putative component of membrane protein insertase Oxa1/YidC/SpoIIIJ protein YidD